LARAAAYVVLLAWSFLGLYIYSEISSGGLKSHILRFFLSAEQSGIKFRAAMLLGPFVLTVIGYLINERARLFERTLLAQKELEQRTGDLEKINLLLSKENAERRKTEEQLVRRAFHDALTNLPNRALFMDHLQNALERGRRNPDHKFAVFFLDVDRFKVINDGLGHFIGDQLLIMLSQRLKKSMRAIDTVARFGGDEFAILMEDVRDIAQVRHLSDRLKEEMRPPFSVAGHEIFVTVSVGIVLSDAGEYRRTDEFLRDADIAMYDAKAKGRARHVIFDSEMHAEAARMLRLETELRRAVERNEFILHYQPIIKMEGNEIIGFEALVRWRHPERGLIPPLDFITVAEES
jgi:diguanylate cyclase (GGDEF)-like protein